ncbi:MAG: zinc-dependent alcohol dehydrogenase family protein [Gallionella sp.]|nr:zinc-dependent alcohol dehydrogenase family protein [Gallionella sp.]
MQTMLTTSAGGIDVMHLRDLDVPEVLSPLHLRVKLAAAGINPLDTKLRMKPVYYPDKLPAILGCDGAGIVDEIGTEVTRFKVGDQVYFNNGGIGLDPGCYAEYTTLHEDCCAAKPANLSMQDSAAIPLVLITAWEALVEKANIQPGQTVLIHGGAGGVGHIAVQLARHLGAKVAVTVSDDKKAALTNSLGAHKVINYKKQKFVDEVMLWTGMQGVDVVLDTVGGETFTKSIQATKIGGKIVSIIATAMTLEDAQQARLRNLTICYELMLTAQLMKMHDQRIRQRKILEEGAKLIEAGKLGVLVSRQLPLIEVGQAHKLIEKGGVMGKIIVTMGLFSLP